MLFCLKLSLIDCTETTGQKIKILDLKINNFSKKLNSLSTIFLKYLEKYYFSDFMNTLDYYSKIMPYIFLICASGIPKERNQKILDSAFTFSNSRTK
jgi:hypothetical protein